jgi:hypothetical protein
MDQWQAFLTSPCLRHNRIPRIEKCFGQFKPLKLLSPN